mmetsp:Transcript_25578/g.89139  ORF Transcript_25578/g.89139 Transcript_25578/m.89139 type:complete len:229 (-) Transcript_25578:963-1649(-)
MFSFKSKEQQELERDPAKQVKQWTRNMRKEENRIDREIRALERAVEKVKREMKAAHKKGHMGALKTLAKEVVRTRGAIERMHVSKAQIHSVAMQLTNQMSMVKMAGAMGKSAEVMSMMGKLINAPAVGAAMRQMAMEMEKAGIIDEVMSEAMEELDGDEVEEEGEAEVDRIIAEITMGSVTGLADAPAGKAGPDRVAAGGAGGAEPAAAKEEEEDPELEAMQARLGAL